MNIQRIQITTQGESFYPITEIVEQWLKKNISRNSGILYLFLIHTSCALTISENYDPTARKDLESFLKHLAPRNLPYIQHTLEGEDDSPSHMKSILLQQHLAIPVEDGQLILGQWQGIFLAEFRDKPHQRTLLLKFSSD